MLLKMSVDAAKQYSSSSQKIRIMSEEWVRQNMFCPYCGGENLNHFSNNRPVADFFCPTCREEYELKSKNATFQNKVVDGAYKTMIQRIQEINNPNFFFLQYRKEDLMIENFMMVPKHFLTVEMIEKRKPLAENARRAGWIGCNMLIRKIPKEGRIYIVKDEEEIPINHVIDEVHRLDFIRHYKLDSRGWIIDMLNCINQIDEKEFTLDQVYQFESALSTKHPNNHFIKDKIRQQLQILRDHGVIEFMGRGHYRKI